jgi:hypothetical protein
LLPFFAFPAAPAIEHGQTAEIFKTGLMDKWIHGLMAGPAAPESAAPTKLHFNSPFSHFHLSMNPSIHQSINPSIGVPVSAGRACPAPRHADR